MAAGPGSRSFARVSTAGLWEGGRAGVRWGGVAGLAPSWPWHRPVAGDTGARRSGSVTAVPSLLIGGLLAF